LILQKLRILPDFIKEYWFQLPNFNRGEYIARKQNLFRNLRKLFRSTKAPFWKFLLIFIRITFLLISCLILVFPPLNKLEIIFTKIVIIMLNLLWFTKLKDFACPELIQYLNASEPFLESLYLSLNQKFSALVEMWFWSDSLDSLS